MLSEELGLQQFLEGRRVPVLVALGRSSHHRGTTQEIPSIEFDSTGDFLTPKCDIYLFVHIKLPF